MSCPAGSLTPIATTEKPKKLATLITFGGNKRGSITKQFKLGRVLVRCRHPLLNDTGHLFDPAHHRIDTGIIAVVADENSSHPQLGRRL